MPNTSKPTPPIVDADFDETIKNLLAVKPPPSGKKARAERFKGKKASTKEKTKTPAPPK